MKWKTSRRLCLPVSPSFTSALVTRHSPSACARLCGDVGVPGERRDPGGIYGLIPSTAAEMGWPWIAVETASLSFAFVSIRLHLNRLWVGKNRPQPSAAPLPVWVQRAPAERESQENSNRINYCHHNTRHSTRSQFFNLKYFNRLNE